MNHDDSLPALLDRIVAGQASEQDIATLRQALTQAGAGTVQMGKYNVAIERGEDIHIGDKVYQGADADIIKKTIRAVFAEIPSPQHFQNDASNLGAQGNFYGPVTINQGAHQPAPPPPGPSTAPVVPNTAPAPNPFGDTGCITDAARFFDREELLREIFEEVSKGTSLSLVGESQIGKSSVLKRIEALGRERVQPPPDHSVYLSLQHVDDEDEFYEALCESLGIATCRGGKLTRALQGRRCLLCIDEIEKMAWDGFTVKVRSHLRGLAGGRDEPLTLVIASRSPLDRLFPDSPELDSPLSSICHQINVEPFTPEIARAFLLQRLQGTGMLFTDAQIHALLTQSGGHPARLQRAAAELYRRLAQEL
jgi:hypothetical protein